MVTPWRGATMEVKMTKRFCDLCECEIARASALTHFYAHGRMITVSIYSINREQLDVCGGCVKDHLFALCEAPKEEVPA